MQGVCHSSKYNRKIERTHNLERHKQIIRARLTSDQGLKRRKKRTADVEPVFGHMNQIETSNGLPITHKGIGKV